LLEDVYGELPHGFLGLVKSPSVADLSKAGFRHLYDLLSAGKVNPLQLHGQPLDDRLLEVMLVLPEVICCVKVARNFPHERNWEKFSNQIMVLENITEKQLRQDAYGQLLSGAKPVTIVRSFLSALIFDAPVLPPCDEIQHIGTAKELFHVAKVFENCLARNLPEALSGTHQFYRHSDNEYVFSIKKLTKTQWIVDEVQKRGEMFCSLDDVPELADVLEGHGIHSEKGHTYKVLKSLINL
jgi:hypothetical protein